MSDCDLPQYYVWKEPVAKKAHGCCECNARILPGEKYLQVNGCWEGRPDVFRQHLVCAAACELVRDSGMNDDECVFYGGLKEFFNDSRSSCWSVKYLAARKQLWRLMLQIARRERKEPK